MNTDKHGCAERIQNSAEGVTTHHSVTPRAGQNGLPALFFVSVHQCSSVVGLNSCG